MPPPKKNRQRNQLLITAGVMAVLAIGVVAALLTSSTEAPPLGQNPPPVEGAPKRPLPVPKPKQASPSNPAGPELVDDDGRTLWVSPTAGKPIELDYLPPGCDFVLHLRPAELLASERGRGVMAALGPQGAQLTARLAAVTGYQLSEIQELLVGVRGAGQNKIEAAIVLTPTDELPRNADDFLPPALYRTVRSARHNGADYRVGPVLCCFVPPDKEGRRVVYAPRAALIEVLEAGGAAPPMRRELELLAGKSDRTRHATLLLSPSFLFTDGRTLFSGVTQALRDPVFEFHPDELRAASVSMHWGEDFFLEARGCSSAELTATRLAALLHSRIAKWASDLQLAVLDLSPDPHGRRLVARLPAMTQLLAEQARFGAEGDAAVLNCYLPLPAGENLLAAAELMLAQMSAGAGGRAPTTVKAAPPAATIQQKLRQSVSVAFARDTLEMAVQYLAEELGTPIVILGGDLQLEGITKNQSFGMSASSRSAQSVLLEIVQKANPDKTATGPRDSKQKLVYIVKPSDNGTQTIYITTRASAAKRGDKLPEVFEVRE